MIADQHFYGRQFESTLNDHGITLLRPTRAGETHRPGARLFKPLRQVIESINDTLKVSSTPDNTAGTPRRGAGSAACNASWPSPRASGTTTTAAHRPRDH